MVVEMEVGQSMNDDISPNEMRIREYIELRVIEYCYENGKVDRVYEFTPGEMEELLCMMKR